MFGLGLPEILVILVVILVLFGAGKLPEVLGQLGKGVKEFKGAVKGEEETPAPAPKPKAAPKKPPTKKPVAKKTSAKKKAATKK